MSGLPFKIITPSWVIPGTYLENIRFLSEKDGIDGVELLFFLFDDEIRVDFMRELAGIREFCDRFTVTAHLPDNLLPEHEALVDILAPFVKHFIVHPPRNTGNAANLAEFLHSWMEKFGRERFLIENTTIKNITALLNFFDDSPLCMDTGHLLLEGGQPASYAAAYSSRIKEVHLHGLDRAAAAVDGRLADHRSIPESEPWFNALLPFLQTFTGIVNIEVFSWSEAAVTLSNIEHSYAAL
ncbi:hypothetical protein FACS189494_01400 [Spirochaetia bacterium]|nr:hypothetical protein FACS189494_01400 [Spirochaetia bacterium]